MAYKKTTNPINVMSHRPESNSSDVEWRPNTKDRTIALDLKFISDLEYFKKNPEQFKIAPDTTGVDFFFLQYFILWPMADEFWVIASAFLKNCYQEIPEFVKLGWSFPQQIYFQSVTESLQQRILNLILNGFRSGNSYCTELLKHLYKTYYKKEYNQLKRFRSITLPQLFTLADTEEYDNQWGNVARILVMCSVFGIEQIERCGMLYLYLDDLRKEYEDDPEPLHLDHDQLDNSRDLVETWTSEDMQKPARKRQKTYWEIEHFLENCFRYQGMPEDFLWSSGMSCPFDKEDWSKVHALLKTTFPQRDFTYEEVQHYGHIYQLADAFTNLYWEYRDAAISLLGLHKHEFHGEYQGHILFNPELVLANAQPRKPAKMEVKKPIITNIAPVSTSHASEEDYMTEISELRRRLHEQEQENRNLREQYRITRKQLKDTQYQLSKYEQDRDELITLRNHVYQESQDISEIPEADLESMQKTLAEHSILIVGGHINWHNRLRQLFPKWKFIDIHHYSTVDVKVVEGVDKVYFFTDYLSHLTYRKMINAIRNKKVEFGYVGNVNVERFVQQVYQDLEG